MERSRARTRRDPEEWQPQRLRPHGPSPRARTSAGRKTREGAEVYDLRERGLPFAVIGPMLGMSATTAWRRYWFFWDSLLYPEALGTRHCSDVVQRGTRECPSGSPWARSIVE